MPRYCRGCCRFVAGRLATCRSCGHHHTADAPALEEPIRTRRRSNRYRPNRYRR